MALSIALLLAACGGNSDPVAPSDTPGDTPIAEEYPEDSPNEGEGTPEPEPEPEDESASLARLACEEYEGTYRAAGESARSASIRYADAAAEENPIWIGLVSNIETAIDVRNRTSSADPMLVVALFEEQHAAERAIGETCLENFGLELTYANGRPLIDASAPGPCDSYALDLFHLTKFALHHDEGTNPADVLQSNELAFYQIALSNIQRLEDDAECSRDAFVEAALSEARYFDFEDELFNEAAVTDPDVWERQYAAITGNAS